MINVTVFSQYIKYDKKQVINALLKLVSTNIMICHNRGNIVITISIHFKRFFLKEGAPKTDMVVCLKVKETLFGTNGIALT